MPIDAARWTFAADGTPYSTLYDDVYHAAAGGLAQARHVFIQGNRLTERWAAGRSGTFTIFETGFGIGLNFLATWQAWHARKIEDDNADLHFVSVEKHPFRRDDLVRVLAPLAAAESSLVPAIDALTQQWPPLATGAHRLRFDAERIKLTLLWGDALDWLAAQECDINNIDAIYLDGFAPAKNPDLWSDAVLTPLTRRCRPCATLATWSVAGALRRRLQSLGWKTERRPGFAHKREMLTAILPA